MQYKFEDIIWLYRRWRKRKTNQVTLANLRHVHMGSQFPSPTHASKSQHEGKVPTLKPQETIQIWFLLIKDKSCKKIHERVF